MSARAAVASQLPLTKAHIRDEWADEILKALTAAGYRILAPGEVDRETVERCLVEVEDVCESDHSDHDVIRFIRKRLRTLTDGGHDA